MVLRSQQTPSQVYEHQSNFISLVPRWGGGRKSERRVDSHPVLIKYCRNSAKRHAAELSLSPKISNLWVWCQWENMWPQPGERPVSLTCKLSQGNPIHHGSRFLRVTPVNSSHVCHNHGGVHSVHPNLGPEGTNNLTQLLWLCSGSAFTLLLQTPTLWGPSSIAITLLSISKALFVEPLREGKKRRYLTAQHLVWNTGVFHCPKLAAGSLVTMGLQLVETERGSAESAHTYSKQHGPSVHALMPGWRRSQ